MLILLLQSAFKSNLLLYYYNYICYLCPIVIVLTILVTAFQYLVQNYNEDEYIRWLLDNTRIHILPSMNPDGFSVAKEGTCQGARGRWVSEGNVEALVCYREQLKP